MSDPRTDPNPLLASGPCRLRMFPNRSWPLSLAALLVVCSSQICWAHTPSASPPLAPPQHLSATDRPKVVLDKLEFPAVLGGKAYERHLRRVLKKEVALVDWGAGADSTIEYRFAVQSLTVQQKGDVLLIKCVASGTLPRGRQAQSQLSFGGSPRNHSALIRRVLTIVARGVITRLAEIERVRRGEER